MESIVLKLKNGDVQALKILYELFYKSTFNAAFFITRDSGLAEDAIHDVFIKVHEKIDQLEDISKIESWLCRMSANRALDIIRNRSRSILTGETQIISISEEHDSLENIIVNNEAREIIKHNINNLKHEYKIVVYYKYYIGLTIREISTILVVPEGTVKTWLIRARKEMKKKLAESEKGQNRLKPGMVNDPKGVNL